MKNQTNLNKIDIPKIVYKSSIESDNIMNYLNNLSAYMQYQKLGWIYSDERNYKERNPYINEMNGFEEVVFNYDNTVLFVYRYLDRDNIKKKQYRNRSLLFNYCRRVTDTELKAILIFISLGKLGILDIVDLIEAENYIVDTNPSKYGNGYTSNLYPPRHKHYFIQILDLVKNGITNE